MLRVMILQFGLLAYCSACSPKPCWDAVTTQFNVGPALLLTDGRILIQQFNTSNWWTLTPNHGVYHTGTFTRVASFPTSLNYAHNYFASAVLPDGRVIVEGGEDNFNVPKWTTKGAIYDPVKNVWTPVAPPTGWTTIGDAQSVVLPNGTFMLANCCDVPPQAALLNAATLTWKILNSTSGYKNKNDNNDEEGWTLLPDGKVLTIDTYWSVPYNPTAMNSEIYDPVAGSWSSAGNTVQQLWDSRAACGKKTSNETGNAVLMPNGMVFATGANSCLDSDSDGTAGHTALYDTATGVWTAGPDIPGGNDVADGPAALLPNGHVLVDTNPGYGNNPSTLYEFNGTSFLSSIPQPVGLNPSNTEGGRMLVTPAGTVLLTHLGSPNIWFYSPAGTYQSSWQPHICPGCYPAVGFIGSTYTVSGTQFNGLSQGASFGDDGQSATNYPIVRITNNSAVFRITSCTLAGVMVGVLPRARSIFVHRPAVQKPIPPARGLLRRDLQLRRDLLVLQSRSGRKESGIQRRSSESLRSFSVLHFISLRMPA
jgi:hypothetical protein